MADFNGTVGFDDVRADNVIAYISPSFSGFSFMGAVIAPGGATLSGDANINSDSLAEAFSLAAIYSNGPFYASLAYESMGSEIGMSSATSLAGSSACINPDGTRTLSCDYVGDDFTKWKIGLGLLDWNGFTLAGIFSQQNDRFPGQTRQAFNFISPDGTINSVGINGVEEQTLWQIQAGYAFGNNKVKAMYGSVDRDDGGVLQNTRDVISLNNLRNDLEGDRYTWAIGFDHNFSKRTKAYVLYTQVEDDRSDTPGFGKNDGRDWDGFSLGMIHKF